MGDDRHYFNARQAAAYLGVKRQRVYDLVAAGRLLPISPGLFVFTQAALDQYKQERAQRPKGGRPPKPRPAGRSSTE